METQSLARVVEEMETGRTMESIVTGGMLAVMTVVLVVQAVQSLGSRLEATAAGYPALAANEGLVWIQVTPAGEPNQVRVISENSSGAFEEVLLGLTT